jgi:glycosyltransferase involved in cell wall biosynthesis
MNRRNVPYVIVPGVTLDNTKAISIGQVLDAHGRSYFAMSQMMNLVKMMREGEVTGEDIIFFEDMFQPGIESLPYIMNQIPEKDRPKVWVRCLAQTIDPDDFVHVWGMAPWMSKYEHMVNDFVTGVLASNEEMVAHMKIAGWTAPIYNISGLTFDKDEVRSRVSHIPEFSDRRKRIVFAARFDQEKQPGFFMDLAEELTENIYGLEFAILSGGPLRSNDPKYVERARELEKAGMLSIYDNLSKNEYYKLLAESRVLFNCALQDWVSNTVSEADALGCNVLFPAYRSFPETFANDYERLYIPWSKDDARMKLSSALLRPHKNQGKISDWTSHTMDRILDIMLGEGEAWARNDNRYRNHVSIPKY